MHHHILRDGHEIPAIGYGTYPMDDAEAEANVSEAILRGYRLIDTAAQYGNEEGVGRGIRAAETDRDELFVQTKLAGKDHGHEKTMAACKESLHRLGLEHLDLYLIHWPNPSVDLYVDPWRAMIELRDQGLVRSIGTSNFLPEHLQRLEEETGEMPVVNQIEVQVQYQQEALRAFHAEHRIITQAWSPLGRMKALGKDSVVGRIAQEIGASPAQVVLRWQVQNQIIPLPKSSDPERMEQNLNVFDWELSEEDMHRLHLAHTGIGLKGFDPRTHEEF